MELYRVLLVDDEEDIREGISRKMDWLGLGFSLVGVGSLWDNVGKLRA